MYLKKFKLSLAKFLFLTIVIIPNLLVILYYIIIASDKYESTSIVTVKQTGERPNIHGFPFFGFGNPISREDAFLLKEYILSYDMLDYLETKLDLRNIYSKETIDFLSRLNKDATKEDFYKYYKKHIKVLYDEFTGVLTLKVYAYTPEDSKRINEAILEQSERYLNGISHRIAQEQVDFIKRELYQASHRMQEARQRLLDFQNRHRVLDPSAEAQAISGIITHLEAQLASKEAELKTLLTYMSENSFQVQALKSQISALKKQIEKEKARLVGEGSTKLNRISMEYFQLKLSADFATDIYRATLSAYEATRVEASRKLKNLVIIQSPTLPEEPLSRQKIYNISLIMISTLLIFAILMLVISIIKEHRV